MQSNSLSKVSYFSFSCPQAVLWKQAHHRLGCILTADLCQGLKVNDKTNSVNPINFDTEFLMYSREHQEKVKSTGENWFSRYQCQVTLSKIISYLQFDLSSTDEVNSDTQTQT